MSHHPNQLSVQDSFRPHTPGTPGTFDTRYSGNFQDNSAFAAQYDPHNRAFSPVPQDTNHQTYYFDKEGGAAGTGAFVSGEAPGKASKGGVIGWIKNHRIITGIIALVIVAAIVAGSVGGAVGSSHSNLAANGHDNTSGNNNNPASTSSNNGKGSSSSGSTGSSSNSSNSSSTPQAIVPLAKWNLTDPQSKIVGVSIGNWLVLERWLSEDWFTGLVGQEPTDEWTFTQTLGNTKALSALQQHWDSWISESDIDQMQSVGINTVRVPIGYWAFVQTASGEPYLSLAGQTDRLETLLGWLYSRGMYAMIDLHGMPGSQNGDQSSGHNTTNIAWFNNQYFSLNTEILNATVSWIKSSNYSSVVSSVCPVNEPRPNGNSGKLSQLTNYYESAYNTLKANGLIMMFHHGFVSNPYTYWASFASGKDPNYLAFNDNPYPGWFPANPSSSNIINQVCQLAQSAEQFPVPVVMTEYSLANGVNTTSFEESYYDTQLSAYSWSGGSFFWTWLAMNSSDPVQAEPAQVMVEYSMKTLIQQGLISNVSSSSGTLNALNALPNQQCGQIPTVTWSNPSGNTNSNRR